MKRFNKKSQGRKPRAIDLFSGCGGLTLGLSQAEFEVIAAVEVDPLAVSAYNSNHSGVMLKHCDIRKVSARALRRELHLQVGELELLAGCPPCQGFSALRTRNGAKRNRDARNSLIGEMLRFARAFRPKAIMMENVPGLALHKPFREFCAGLRSIGYKIKVEIKDAARYGVPQRRRRLILLAGRGFDIEFAPESSRVRTVRGAIGRLPEPGRSRDKLHNLPEKKRADKIQKLI